MGLRDGRSGEELSELVQHYDGLGQHRTGTPGDMATVEWLTGLLGADLDVETVPYEFEQFRSTTSLHVDGTEMEHLPLFYEAAGTMETADAEVVPVKTISNFVAPALDGVIAAARGPALIVPTLGPSDELVAFNRATAIGTGTPVVLVAGRHTRTLFDASRIELTHDARIAPGQSANVLARGGTSGPEIVLTTPLTGWFHCAGERGPGIALLVDVATRLAAHARVTVIAASGHELHHAGARAWIDRVGDALHPDAVVHLGASIATGPPVEHFSGERVRTQLPSGLDAALAEIYADADQPFDGVQTEWLSEAKEWVDRTDLVLSYSGSFPLFHTPADRAGVATTPDRLAAAAAKLDRSLSAIVAHLMERTPR